MIITKKAQIVLIVLAILNIVAIFGYGFMFYKISTEKSRTAETLSLLKSEVKKESTLRFLAETLDKTTIERGKIDRYFVDIKGSAVFLERLQFFGKQAGVSVRLENVDIEDKTVLRVNLATNGGFGETYKFLELLENTPYAIEVKSININKVRVSLDDKKNTSPNNWSGVFTIRLLSFVNK